MNLREINYKKKTRNKCFMIAMLVCIISVAFIGADIRDSKVAGDEDIEIIPFYIKSDSTMLVGDEDIEIIPFIIKPESTILAGDEDIEIIPFFIKPDPTLLAGDEDIEIIPFLIKPNSMMLGMSYVI